MKKKAKLISVSFTARVIVSENATDEKILEVARPKFLEKVQTELGEHLESIEDDTECPYGTLDSDPFYLGQKVWWDDPDEGLSSGEYTVYEVTEEWLLISNGFSEAQVPYHELKIR